MDNATMHRIYALLIIIVFMMVGIQNIHGAGVEISKVWSSNIFVDGQGNYVGYAIDVDVSPSIYVELVNHDTYQHNVKVLIKTDEDKSWTSPTVILFPNSNKGKTIHAKLKFDEMGIHKIQIDVLDENGNTIASKTASIDVISPIDVKNITCEESYINESNPNIEVCSSPYFVVILKSNKYAQTDYLVKTWIAVVSKDYDKDASKNKNDKGVLYYGENESKMIYVPMHGEASAVFKIPKIVQQDSDIMKIQVHTEIMGVHGYTDSPEETVLDADSDLNIKYEDIKYHKEFEYPIALMDFHEMTTLDDNTSKILREYYWKSGIRDEEIEDDIRNHITDTYYDILPRAYLKSEPYLAIVKLTLKNRCDYKVSGTISIKDDVGTIYKDITLDKFETKDIYMPCYINYSGDKKIELSICSANTYVFNKTETLGAEPNKVPPVKIVNITYSYDNITHNIHNNNVGLFVGRNYTLKVVMVNNYNKTLSGTLYISDEDFKEGVVNCSSNISFELMPHSERAYLIPIRFNTGANGDLKLIVKTNDALDDYSKILHINAYNVDVDLEYVDNLKPKVAVVNRNPVFQYYPVAGYTNEFVAKLNNPLDEDIRYITWLEAVDNTGKLMATTQKKWVYLPSKDSGGIASLDYNIKFNQGFCGYILFYAVPIDKNGNISNMTYPIHPVLTKSIDVIAPLTINNITYYNRKVQANITSASFDGYPVAIDYNYWVEVDKDGSAIYKSNLQSETLRPGGYEYISTIIPKLANGNYTLKFHIDIPDFILDNGKYYPMTLEKSLEITVGNNTSNTSVGSINSESQIQQGVSASISNHSNKGNIGFNESQTNQTNQTNNSTASKGLLDGIYSAIMGIIDRII
jgi:hypothetical protein